MGQCAAVCPDVRTCYVYFYVKDNCFCQSTHEGQAAAISLLVCPGQKTGVRVLVKYSQNHQKEHIQTQTINGEKKTTNLTKIFHVFVKKSN